MTADGTQAACTCRSPGRCCYIQGQLVFQVLPKSVANVLAKVCTPQSLLIFSPLLRLGHCFLGSKALLIPSLLLRPVLLLVYAPLSKKSESCTSSTEYPCILMKHCHRSNDLFCVCKKPQILLIYFGLPHFTHCLSIHAADIGVFG